MEILKDLLLKFASDKMVYVNKVPLEVCNKYIHSVNEILSEDSSNVEALKFKQFLLFYIGEYAESAEVCDIMQKYSHNDIDILKRKLACLQYLGENRGIISTCQRILEIDPKNEDAISMWKTACLSQDGTLPVPPKSFADKIIEIILVIIFVGIVFYFLLNFPS